MTDLFKLINHHSKLLRLSQDEFKNAIRGILSQPDYETDLLNFIGLDSFDDILVIVNNKDYFLTEPKERKESKLINHNFSYSKNNFNNNIGLNYKYDNKKTKNNDVYDPENTDYYKNSCIDDLRFPKIEEKIYTKKDFIKKEPNKITQHQFYTEVEIPATPCMRTMNPLSVDTNITSSQLKYFPSYKYFNAVQSIVFDTAYKTNKNFLVCAPTGCGKTDVAFLGILRELNIRKSKINDNINDHGKIFFVVPMKALATEIVNKLEKRLNVPKNDGKNRTKIKIDKKNQNKTEVNSEKNEKNEKISNSTTGLIKNMKKLSINEKNTERKLGSKKEIQEEEHINILEYTGDTETPHHLIQKADILVCTPEKLDVSTRKLSNNIKISLLIIDEIHLLRDEGRGHVLESLVSRMFRYIEIYQKTVRIIGLSATLPNFKDVARFIRGETVFYFGKEYRPVELEISIVGVKESNNESKKNHSAIEHEDSTSEIDFKNINKGENIFLKDLFAKNSESEPIKNDNFNHKFLKKEFFKTKDNKNDDSSELEEENCIKNINKKQENNLNIVNKSGMTKEYQYSKSSKNYSNFPNQELKNSNKNDENRKLFKRDIKKSKDAIMNEFIEEKLYELLKEGHQSLIFVTSRKSTVYLSKYLQSKLPSYIFDIHHAGLPRNTRLKTEEKFRKKEINVLVSTSTLAWGVNLPAKCVFIKGTTFFNPEKSKIEMLGILDILQMFGRAGRPQYNTTGKAYLLTENSNLNLYLKLIENNTSVESNLLSKVVDVINAEIYLGTICDIDTAVKCIKGTFLFVRMCKVPLLYGFSKKEIFEGNIDKVIKEYVVLAVRRLIECGLIRIKKEIKHQKDIFSKIYEPEKEKNLYNNIYKNNNHTENKKFFSNKNDINPENNDDTNPLLKEYEYIDMYNSHLLYETENENIISQRDRNDLLYELAVNNSKNILFNKEYKYESTTMGRIASHCYLCHETMKEWEDCIDYLYNEESILDLLFRSVEFKDIIVREEEVESIMEKIIELRTGDHRSKKRNSEFNSDDKNFYKNDINNNRDKIYAKKDIFVKNSRSKFKNGDKEEKNCDFKQFIDSDSDNVMDYISESEITSIEKMKVLYYTHKYNIPLDRFTLLCDQKLLIKNLERIIGGFAEFCQIKNQLNILKIVLKMERSIKKISANLFANKKIIMYDLGKIVIFHYPNKKFNEEPQPKLQFQEKIKGGETNTLQPIEIYCKNKNLICAINKGTYKIIDLSTVLSEKTVENMFRCRFGNIEYNKIDFVEMLKKFGMHSCSETFWTICDDKKDCKHFKIFNSEDEINEYVNKIDSKFIKQKIDTKEYYIKNNYKNPNQTKNDPVSLKNKCIQERNDAKNTNSIDIISIFTKNKLKNTIKLSQFNKNEKTGIFVKKYNLNLSLIEIDDVGSKEKQRIITQKIFNEHIQYLNKKIYIITYGIEERDMTKNELNTLISIKEMPENTFTMVKTLKEHVISKETAHYIIMDFKECMKNIDQLDNDGIVVFKGLGGKCMYWICDVIDIIGVRFAVLYESKSILDLYKKVFGFERNFI